MKNPAYYYSDYNSAVPVLKWALDKFNVDFVSTNEVWVRCKEKVIKEVVPGELLFEKVDGYRQKVYLTTDNLIVQYNILDDKDGYLNWFKVFYPVNRSEEVDTLIGRVNKLNVKAEPKKHVNLVIKTDHGLALKSIELKSSPMIDFDCYYNDNFDNEGIDRIIADNSNGLVLLGGLPGTGKSTYIKWLIANSGRKVVYLPSYMTSALEDPGFINFTVETLKDCILVIEDCETIMRSRDISGNTSVSTILNLSDGIMGDLTNILIIATYNTKDAIDTALFRKGRLLYTHEFTKLSVEKCNSISKLNELNVEFNQEHTLSEVLNWKVDNGVEQKVVKAIGFGR